jgi:hypothetical protein
LRKTLFSPVNSQISELFKGLSKSVFIEEAVPTAAMERTFTPQCNPIVLIVQTREEAIHLHSLVSDNGLFPGMLSGHLKLEEGRAALNGFTAGQVRILITSVIIVPMLGRCHPGFAIVSESIRKSLSAFHPLIEPFPILNGMLFPCSPSPCTRAHIHLQTCIGRRIPLKFEGLLA